MFTNEQNGGNFMQSYTEYKVNEELPGIVILSHGALAVGLVDTVKMLFGDPENVAAFSLEAGDDIDQYRKTFAKTFESFPEGSIILADLYGGTPCNQVLLYAQESGKALKLVCGVNLPMLLNVIISREADKDGLVEAALDNGKAGITDVDVAGFIAAADDDDEDDE